jgi:hypothetical protein
VLACSRAAIEQVATAKSPTQALREFSGVNLFTNQSEIILDKIAVVD